ncbi:hypothetical protein [Martelella mediterranea]|uniref:Uncharacterized protein n=1 Tax=Martelella mediterranea TaxID=293089 RepID=A0A4R3NIV8_9HYPH|nr:hypothetical protein [Martelella mediterranea]TCT34661.1 hypothetical protein EDC90_103355 [Martelella mediterranea]
MFSNIKAIAGALAGAVVAAAMVYLVFQLVVVPNAREGGREAERADINQDTLNAVKERVKDDAKRETLSGYELCLDYFRHRGRLPECEQLRSLREEQP